MREWEYEGLLGLRSVKEIFPWQRQKKNLITPNKRYNRTCTLDASDENEIRQTDPEADPMCTESFF